MSPKSLDKALKKRYAIHAEVIDKYAMYNLLRERDYVGIKFSEEKYSLIPIEFLYPDYFKDLRLQ